MNLNMCSNLLPEHYVRKGQDAANTQNKLLEYLLYHRKIPEESWNSKMIEDVMLALANSSPLSTKGFTTNANDMVIKRNYVFSGCTPYVSKKIDKKDMSAEICHLANSFITELIGMMGIKTHFDCAVVPVATGMSLIFSMLALRFLKPTVHYVIWSRIDQKSCFKSIITAGFKPIVINTKCLNGEHITDIDRIEQTIKEIGARNINFIISTTSCFAPRACDDIEAIAEICDKHDIFHLINNAYGLSNRYIMKRINKASLKGRVDVFVQSTDKNLCVPVGGAVVASFNKQIFSKFIEICSEKMSISAALDVVITLLNIGKKKYLDMVNDCEAVYGYLKHEMFKLAEKYNEKIVNNPSNPISIALTLSNVPKASLTDIGSMLYTRNVSGARIITAEETKIVCGFKFERWGTHCDDCQIPYLTAAASIGILRNDVDIFIHKLDKVLEKVRRRKN